jgi:hydroxymethylbilane synthase
MTLAVLRIGTRGSRLALAQSRMAAEALAGSGIAASTELLEIATRGDAISIRRPAGDWVATDGQFTVELERALREQRVDLVVHSYKDLPTAEASDLAIAAVLERGDPRDCLVSRHGDGLDSLPYGGRVGTSSPRRAAQLCAARPDLVAAPIRGNVETRLARLGRGEFDAVMLAAAGLDRLGIDVPDGSRLSLEMVLPAPAQAALALQVRAADGRLRNLLRRIDHGPTRVAVEAERRLLRRIGGGCLAPLGALGEVRDGKLRLRAAYEHRDGAFVRADVTGAADDAEAIVTQVAREITAQLEPAR